MNPPLQKANPTRSSLYKKSQSKPLLSFFLDIDLLRILEPTPALFYCIFNVNQKLWFSQMENGDENVLSLMDEVGLTDVDLVTMITRDLNQIFRDRRIRRDSQVLVLIKERRRTLKNRWKIIFTISENLNIFVLAPTCKLLEWRASGHDFLAASSMSLRHSKYTGEVLKLAFVRLGLSTTAITGSPSIWIKMCTFKIDKLGHYFTDSGK